MSEATVEIDQVVNSVVTETSTVTVTTAPSTVVEASVVTAGDVNIATVTTSVDVTIDGDVTVVSSESGPQGIQGIPGAGVPVGGTTGQVLTKIDATDRNTQWSTPDTSFNPVLISLTWGTPGSEVANAREVEGSCAGLNGTPYAAALVDVEVKVTDSAGDVEPSSTATLSSATTPVGSVLGGSGTATLVIRTDASGNIKVRVTESLIGFRYLWVRQSGNSRVWVRPADGVLELAFA